MKIVLISVGTIREAPLRELADRFAGRIPHYMPFDACIIPDVAASRNSSADQRKIKEGEAILGKIAPGDFVVLFDERGRELTSREFAELIEKKSIVLPRNLILVIGGPYGFSDAVFARADMKLSLSRMTFTHEMARVIALEQIYRAMTILRGEPYHHD